MLSTLNPLRNRANDHWLWTLARRYDVPPTMPLPVMISREGVCTVEPRRWGLIPSWSKDMKGGFSTFSARSDGVDTKLSFKGTWKAGRRGLVLVGGFYEWRKAGVVDKQPFAFTMGNRDIMELAGLRESWKSSEDWPVCTIITTNANDLMAPIHDRMPVILGSEDWTNGLGRIRPMTIN